MSVKKSVVGFLSLVVSLYFSTSTVAQTAAIHELFGFPCDAVTGVCPDGSAPEGSLVQASDGNFYGTTIFGTVPPHGGTVFKISPSGHFSSLKKFVADASGHFSDGDFPVGGLVEVGQKIGWVEGFKAVSDLYSAVGGEFLGANPR